MFDKLITPQNTSMTLTYNINKHCARLSNNLFYRIVIIVLCSVILTVYTRNMMVRYDITDNGIKITTIVPIVNTIPSLETLVQFCRTKQYKEANWQWGVSLLIRATLLWRTIPIKYRHSALSMSTVSLLSLCVGVYRPMFPMSLCRLQSTIFIESCRVPSIVIHVTLFCTDCSF